MTVEVRPARSADDFATVARMQAEMAQWDAAECAALGYPAEGVMAAFYAEDAAALQQMFTGHGAMMLVAVQDGLIVGHAGFTGHDAEVAEVQKVWLDRSARGAGIGGMLLAELKTAMVAAGYSGACIETAVFMQDAIRLYERHGFVRAVPFRDAAGGLAAITIFMRARF